MLQQQGRDVVNPNQWVYAQYYFGRDVSIRQYNRIVTNWTKHQQQLILQESCKATNSIAVNASYLSRRQRDKYKKQRATIGRKSYYYFDRDMIPLDVLNVIDWVDDQLIYDRSS